MNIKPNKAGLYFENAYGICETRTYYPENYDPEKDTNFLRYLSYDKPWKENQPERVFWNRNFMKDTHIFKTFTFYYAEFNHPTLGHAIYRASTNRGFMWKFDSEKDLKCSMCRSRWSMYKTMLKDGYIKIKVGHESYTPN